MKRSCEKQQDMIRRQQESSGTGRALQHHENEKEGTFRTSNRE